MGDKAFAEDLIGCINLRTASHNRQCTQPLLLAGPVGIHAVSTPLYGVQRGTPPALQLFPLPCLPTCNSTSTVFVFVFVLMLTLKLYISCILRQIRIGKSQKRGTDRKHAWTSPTIPFSSMYHDFK